MLSSRSGKNPNSLRSSNSQWQKKQPPPPPQQQKQQLISQDPCAAAVGPTLQWPWSAAHLTEQQVAAYNYWYYQQQRLLLEQQQQQQQLMNMNNYVNQFTTEAPPLPPPSSGDLKSRNRLTAFLERDESFLTPWGKRDMTPEGEEFSFGEYASLYGERQPERMVFQYGSSFFSNQLY